MPRLAANRTLGLSLLALACTGDPSPLPTGGGRDTDAPLPGATFLGVEPDAGFGSAVALSGPLAWASAPHGAVAAVFELTGDAPAVETSGGGRLGASLSAHDGVLLWGAPLDGRAGLAGGDRPLVEAPSAGLAVDLGEDGWVIATGDGWEHERSGRQRTSGRPASLAQGDGLVAAGMPLGAAMLQIGPLAIDREEDGDLAGYALGSGDVLGVGVSSWLVGAPGAGHVQVRDPSGLVLQAVLDPGLPSFGFAIAVADVDGDGLSDVLVGAPEADGGRGTAALYLGGALDQPAARWSGDEFADRLGFSVALGPGRILLGAPGGPGAPGKAHLIPYP